MTETLVAFAGRGAEAAKSSPASLVTDVGPPGVWKVKITSEPGWKHSADTLSLESLIERTEAELLALVPAASRTAGREVREARA